MLAFKKVTKKNATLDDVKRLIYMDVVKLASNDDLNPEFRFAMAMQALTDLKVMNGVMTGRLECPLTHKLLDTVITEMAYRWAEVDPEAKIVIDAMVENSQ